MKSLKKQYFSTKCCRSSFSILLIFVLTVYGIMLLISGAGDRPSQESGSSIKLPKTISQKKVSDKTWPGELPKPALKPHKDIENVSTSSGHINRQQPENQISTTTSGVTSALQARQKTLNNSCNTNNDVILRGGSMRFFISQEKKVVACKAPKTGSSFLGAVFLAITKSDTDMENIFRINRNNIHNVVRTTGIDGIKSRGLDDIKTLSMMVARDPYQRLFSVYIDKVFLLGSIGRGVKGYIGNTKTMNRSAVCGYNASFQNFLDSILRRASAGSFMDSHWAPVSDLCKPCKIKYDIICKTETLTRDTEYVLDRLNLTEAKRRSIKSMFGSKEMRHTVYSLVAAYMSDYTVYKNDCPNVMLLMEKIWKVFQIQGYMHDLVPFPKTEFNNLKDMRPENITDLVMKGIESRPLSREEKYSQRQKAIIDGYRSIKPETIKSIQRIYQKDFLLFGYNINPPR